MATTYTKGTVTSFDALVDALVTWATDASIQGSDVWTLERKEPWPRGTILRAPGRREGDVQHIGLMTNKIVKDKTYRDWFLQDAILGPHFIWSENGVLGQMLRSINPWSEDVSFQEWQAHRSKFTRSNLSINVSSPFRTFTVNLFDPIDIFLSSANVLHLGVFKQYAEDLDWAEQPGGMMFDDLKLLRLPINIWYPGGRVPEYAWYYPPVYPGCGYPSLGMDIDGPKMGKLYYWAAKGRTWMFFVIRNDGEQTSYYDSAFLGQFRPYGNEEYSFPAAVVGGTSGLVDTGRTVGMGGSVYVNTGLQFDYRPSEWSRAHGAAPYTAAPIDDEIAPTSCMVMLPDGRWKGFANWVQTVKAYPIYSGGRLVACYFQRQKPVRAENIPYRIRPTEEDIENFSHVYDKARYLDGSLKALPDFQQNDRRFDLKLEHIEFYSEKTGTLGCIPQMLLPSFAIQPHDLRETCTIGKKRYFYAPDLFYGRPWHMPLDAYSYNVTQDLDKFRTNLTNPDILLSTELERVYRITHDTRGILFGLDETEDDI